jgi:hypothetical protein
MAKLAHLLDTAWADFALDNPVAVARAVALLRKHLATLPEDGHLHAPTADLVDLLESDPATARAAWAEWVAVSTEPARRTHSQKQAARRNSNCERVVTVGDIEKQARTFVHGEPPKKLTVAANLGVSESTIDRVLRSAGTSWKKIKAVATTVRRK